MSLVLQILTLQNLFYLSCIVSLLAVILFIFGVIYIYYCHRLYQHIPGPKRDSFFTGNLPTIRRAHAKDRGIVTDLFFEWHMQYGSVFVFWYYFTPVVTFSDPKAVKEILVTKNLPKAARIYNKIAYCFGERLAGNGVLTETNHEIWKTRRSKLDKAFHKSYLMNLMGSFNSISDTFLAKMSKLADGKTEVEMADEFGRFTLDVIGKVGFGIDINTIEDANSPFPIAVSKTLEGLQYFFRHLFWKLEFWTWPYQNEVIHQIRYLRKFAQEVIEKRIHDMNSGNGEDYKDILAHLISLNAGGNMEYSMGNMVDDFGVFFIAGQETTSNQLAFTLFEILQNVDIKNRIVQEVEDVLGSKQHVDHEDLAKLEYLDMTLRESLRLHPPIAGTQRMVQNKTTIDGIEIPANTAVNVNYYITQNSPMYWKDPEKFDPMRFSLQEKIGRPSTVYIPFSFGPRTCIGKTLAQFEAKVILARLFQEFDLELIPGQTIRYSEQTTIRPKDGVKCVLTKKK